MDNKRYKIIDYASNNISMARTAVFILADYLLIVLAEYIAYGLRVYLIPNIIDLNYLGIRIPAVYMWVFVPFIFLCMLYFGNRKL